MIGHINLKEQVDADFTHALRRAFARRVAARLRGNPSTSRALSFEEVARASGARNKMRAGRRVVAVEKIVGSVGRSGDFDGNFLPIRCSMGERWIEAEVTSFHVGAPAAAPGLLDMGQRANGREKTTHPAAA